MRFIKLFPEGGVWHDNTVNGDGQDIFIRSNDFIFKNHYAFNTDQNDENDKNEKGVCLIEILPGVLDSRRALSSNFFLWVFLGSLIMNKFLLLIQLEIYLIMSKLMDFLVNTLYIKKIFILLLQPLKNLI